VEREYRPNTLSPDAPLSYAPRNELGVVFLFAHIAKRLQFEIEEIRPAFPDCIAYKRTGDREKRVRIEFEFRSSNFRTHKHNPRDRVEALFRGNSQGLDSAGDKNSMALA
jgi:hypothetical protein